MAVPDPQLDEVARAMVRAGARFVVIGGFAVIANRYVRATEDVDLLIPDDESNDRQILAALDGLHAVRAGSDTSVSEEHLLGQEHLRVLTEAGLVDLVREGEPPLDFETVASQAKRADYGDVTFQIASLESIVGFKRLAGRPQDRNDLAALEGIHGELPIQPIPGLDDG